MSQRKCEFIIFVSHVLHIFTINTVAPSDISTPRVIFQTRFSRQRLTTIVGNCRRDLPIDLLFWQCRFLLLENSGLENNTRGCNMKECCDVLSPDRYDITFLEANCVRLKSVLTLQKNAPPSEFGMPLSGIQRFELKGPTPFFWGVCFHELHCHFVGIMHFFLTYVSIHICRADDLPRTPFFCFFLTRKAKAKYYSAASTFRLTPKHVYISFNALR